MKCEDRTNPATPTIVCRVCDRPVQITMTAAGDDNPERKRFATVAVPREALITALAVADSAAGPGNKQKPKLVS